MGQDQSSECFGRMTGLSALLPSVESAANDWNEPFLTFQTTESMAAFSQNLPFSKS